ncbi:fimbrial protein [Cronobacter turicensis]|uniref:fimbrial protein n=1 Tax=Cronobacter turicensis TaxID=413502 RepID=UPI0011ADABAE|nr:fimbrial protein [Cronobacter turicensis]EKY3118320.1 fimbrial protein [Cronobacter turicensis]ELU8454037.1 fimbrial protein [Cronobacter turicensis]ELY3544262.1 fimbrial protein [Cronobacter turicensis]ELY3625246.1 fimbrial protein [Cronobacter turicensis]ELY4111428.1 fimbrial protein [Cronobacter turicensis]
MKKSLLKAGLAALFMAGTMQAIAGTLDDGATLSMNGVITPETAGCSVSLDKSMVILQESISRLPQQGDKALGPAHIMAYITGKNGQGSVECSDAVNAGQIALKFTGVPDAADGTVLANSNTDSNAAKGVGIGIFGPGDYSPVAINSDTLNGLSTLSDLRGAIQFNVEMVKLTDQQVTSGSVSGSLTVQIERL